MRKLKRAKCKLKSTAIAKKPLKERYLKWGKRFLFAGLLLFVFQVVKVLYNFKPDTTTFFPATGKQFDTPFDYVSGNSVQAC